jgi:hypothetical protein
MLRLKASFLGICLCAHAQFFGLATPADGSRIYFATPLRQKNTTQPIYGKLFRVDSSGLQLLLSRNEQIPPPPPPPQAVQTNPYDMVAASVSADGAVFAGVGRRACPYGNCLYYRLEGYTTTVTAAGQDKDYPGYLHLGANGEWAFGGGSSGTYSSPAYLFHVTTGERVPINLSLLDEMNGIPVAATARTVADDGTAVYAAGTDIVIVQPLQTRRISAGSSHPQEPVLDRTGSTVVFSVDNSIRLADLRVRAAAC